MEYDKGEKKIPFFGKETFFLSLNIVSQNTFFDPSGSVSKSKAFNTTVMIPKEDCFVVQPGIFLKIRKQYIVRAD